MENPSAGQPSACPQKSLALFRTQKPTGDGWREDGTSEGSSPGSAVEINRDTALNALAIVTDGHDDFFIDWRGDGRTVSTSSNSLFCGGGSPVGDFDATVSGQAVGQGTPLSPLPRLPTLPTSLSPSVVQTEGSSGLPTSPTTSLSPSVARTEGSSETGGNCDPLVQTGEQPTSPEQADADLPNPTTPVTPSECASAPEEEGTEEEKGREMRQMEGTGEKNRQKDQTEQTGEGETRKDKRRKKHKKKRKKDETEQSGEEEEEETGKSKRKKKRKKDKGKRKRNNERQDLQELKRRRKRHMGEQEEEEEEEEEEERQRVRRGKREKRRRAIRETSSDEEEEEEEEDDASSSEAGNGEPKIKFLQNFSSSAITSDQLKNFVKVLEKAVSIDDGMMYLDLEETAYINGRYRKEVPTTNPIFDPVEEVPKEMNPGKKRKNPRAWFHSEVKGEGTVSEMAWDLQRSRLTEVKSMFGRNGFWAEIHGRMATNGLPLDGVMSNVVYRAGFALIWALRVTNRCPTGGSLSKIRPCFFDEIIKMLERKLVESETTELVASSRFFAKTPVAAAHNVSLEAGDISLAESSSEEENGMVSSGKRPVEDSPRLALGPRSFSSSSSSSSSSSFPSSTSSSTSSSSSSSSSPSSTSVVPPPLPSPGSQLERNKAKNTKKKKKKKKTGPQHPQAKRSVPARGPTGLDTCAQSQINALLKNQGQILNYLQQIQKQNQELKSDLKEARDQNLELKSHLLKVERKFAEGLQKVSDQNKETLAKIQTIETYVVGERIGATQGFDGSCDGDSDDGDEEEEEEQHENDDNDGDDDDDDDDEEGEKEEKEEEEE